MFTFIRLVPKVHYIILLDYVGQEVIQSVESFQVCTYITTLGNMQNSVLYEKIWLSNLRYDSSNISNLEWHYQFINCLLLYHADINEQKLHAACSYAFTIITTFSICIVGNRVVCVLVRFIF